MSNISNISNNITAPCLLIAAMIILIIFQSFIFTRGDVVYAEPESELQEQAGQAEHGGGDYIIFNGVRYRPDRFFILTVAANLSAFLLPAFFYVKLKGEGYMKSLKLDIPKPKYISLGAYMFFVLISGTVLINSLIISAGGADARSESMLPFVINTGGNPVYDMGILISFIALPAFCEEFFFRSVISAEYERYGAFCAVVMTSLAFAVSHFSLKFFPAYFFAGIVFYLFAKITNSVLFAVILHAGYNFFTVYLWTYLSGVLNFQQNRFIFIFLTAITFIVFLLFVLNHVEMIYYKKAYYNDPSPVYLAENKNSRVTVRFVKSFFSPVFIAAAVIFFIYVNISA